MLLDYETICEDSFSEEVHTHKIVNENVLQRFGNCEACLMLLNTKHAKIMRVIGWLLFLHAITAFVVIPYLEKTIPNELVVLSIQFSFSVATLVLYAGFFSCWWRGVNNKKYAVGFLAAKQNLAFHTYFIEFVQHQILPSVNLTHLKAMLTSKIAGFSVQTSADHKNLDNKNIVVVGVYGAGADSVEVSIVLKFNKNYSCLELQNYHVNQRIATSRFGGSDNGC